MGESYKGCVVAFENPIHEDDAEVVLNAIKALRRVAGVTPLVDGPEDWTNREMVAHELRMRMCDILWPKREK